MDYPANKRPAEDDLMDGKRQAGGFWMENPDLAKFDGPYLYEATKTLIGQVFDLIDDDNNGYITAEDFQSIATHEASLMRQWEALRLEFASEQHISPREFVIGVKRQAWKKAVDQTRFTPDSIENFSRFLSSLTDAINTSLKNSLQELLLSMVVIAPETQAKLQEAWLAVDFNRDGSITAADFQRPGVSPEALARFGQVVEQLDANKDGTVTQEEFLLGIKLLALQTCGGSVLTSFNGAATVAGGESRLKRFMAANNAGIVTICNEVILHNPK